jgi:hypothetical protein
MASPFTLEETVQMIRTAVRFHRRRRPGIA